MPSKHLRATKAQLVKEIGRLERRLHAAESVASERKQAEEKLRESEAGLRGIVENSPNLIYMKDTEGRYIHANHVFEAATGLNIEMIGGKRARDIFPKEIADVYESHDRAILRERASVVSEEMVPDASDAMRTQIATKFPILDEAGNVVAIGGINTDITERNKAEAALKESEARLDAFFTNAPIGLALLDDQQRYLKVNDTLAAWNGMASEDQVGKTVGEIYPAYEMTGKASFERIMETGEPVLDQEFAGPPGYRPDDEMVWNVFRFPIPGATEKPAGVGSIVIDITEQKRAAEEILKLNTELEQRVEERTAELRAAQADLVRSERLATLGQLSATVSHELRNPLGTIRNSLVLVDAKVRGKKLGVEQDIERMTRSVSRCDNIISELLEFARARELIRDESAADAWLTEVLDELPVPPDVTVHRKLEAPKAIIAIDSERMRRAVLNVYDNACQAMAEEPEVNGGQRKQELTIRTKATKGRFELTIADTGPGMPPEVFDHAFEPLFSTKGFGVGLGLSIVKQIMEQHDGGIDITSQQGRGTQVMLWLPLRRVKRKKTAR